MGTSSPDPFADHTDPSAASESAPAMDHAALASALEGNIAALIEQGQRGANWFYWVAGLSLVNSVIMLTGGTTYFVVGLGVTLVIDAVAHEIARQEPDIATVLLAIALALDVIVALTVAAFGWLSGKRYLILFGLGMFLYLLDGVLFALIGDWMSVAFHAFALFSMWSGFQAYRQLNAIEDGLQELAMTTGSPS